MADEFGRIVCKGVAGGHGNISYSGTRQRYTDGHRYGIWEWRPFGLADSNMRLADALYSIQIYFNVLVTLMMKQLFRCVALSMTGWTSTARCEVNPYLKKWIL